MKIYTLMVGLSLIYGTIESDNPTYLVYLSKDIRPGFPIQIVAKIMKASNPVNFSAHLTTPAKEINFYVKDTLVQGESKLLTFNEKIPVGYDGTTDFKLSITGVDTVTNKTIISNTTDELRYERKSLSLFIQTDKGIYKPSQTIKFRVVVTNADLLPHNGAISYKLTDPDDNIILQKKNAPLTNGIAGSEFKLGRYSTLGSWIISFECEGNEKSVTVLVDEYQLPKFEIEFAPDQKFLHSESQEYSGKLSAKFTFGEPVKGEASIVLVRRMYRYNAIFGSWSENKTIEIDFKDFDGEAAFSVSRNDLISKLGWDPEAGYSYITVVVKVKEKNSLIEVEETSYLQLVQNPFKIDKTNTPQTAKPGFVYTAYLQVQQFDGSRITEVQRESLDMQIKYTYSYYNPYRSVSEYIDDVSVEKDGYITLSMRVNNSEFDGLYFNVESKKYANYYFAGWSVQRYDSPSKTYVQLSTLKNRFKPDERAEINVLTSRNDVTYSVMMLSRGIIVKQETYTPGNYFTDEDVYRFKYEFDVTKDMAPTVVVAFHFLVGGGEVVADTVMINVDITIPNVVILSTNVTETDTGSPVSITVQTTPGASVAVRAIDRSVILQEEGNDITTETRSGVFVFTDASTFLSQYRGYDTDYYPGIIVEDAMIRPSLEMDVGERVEQKAPPNPKVRKNFPETWIWNEDVAGDDGIKTYPLMLPDTATTWEISVFSVSQQTGLGVPEQDAQIIASRDFFISLTLPPKMVSGEVLSMRTTVYNFFPAAVETTVTLEENEWYALVANTSAEGLTRTITIPSNDGVTVIFPIQFLKTGTAVIKVTALSEIASDAIERTLTIKPEGIQKDISESTLIERDAGDTSDTVFTFDIVIPEGAVEGSVYGKLSVSGSVLGNSWNNLGNLLRMPSGCGEQTMLSFAPDVFISLYLKKVGLLEGELEAKSARHIVGGYQNELRYQHSDGSFSAFTSDKQGSTWLTAFVVKSFIAARELNEDFAHEEKIDPAIKFLLSTQQDDGSFREVGLVRHKAMQGGVSSRETMTAYVLIALTEGGYNNDQEDIILAVTKAKQYLELQLSDIDDIYAISVIAYALAVSGSDLSDTAMNRLDQAATTKENMKYWEVEKPPCESRSGYCWDQGASASDIEMTAYALLTLMKLERQSETMPIVRWMVKQRNSVGGYRSTQVVYTLPIRSRVGSPKNDTVMAIQALSVFAGSISNSQGSITIGVSHSADENFESTISVTIQNAIVLQTMELPPFSGVVTIKGSGIGLADVQLSYQYHLPLTDTENEPFNVETKITKVEGFRKLQMRVCSSINKKAENPVTRTGMFAIVVEVLTGYSADDKAAASLNKQAKMVELDGDELTGYFDELAGDEEVCLVFNMERNMKVGNLKPKMIRAFDYYKPARMSYRMVAPEGSDDLCNTLDKDIKGCNNGGASIFSLSIIASSMLTITTAYLFL